MAAEIGWAGLGIIPTFDKFGTNLERGTSKAMVAAGVTGGEAFGDTAGKSAGRRFNARLKSVAKVGAIGLAATAAAAFKFSGDAIGEAREAAKVGRLTAAAIKSTGGAAKVSEKDVGKLSGRLSNMAGVDDELIQSGANVLLTFTKIRNEAGEGNKVFDQATLAALNMSAALGTDLKGSSIQVGKALNDPVKGVTALGRAGVQFSDDQKSAIKSLVETGDTLKAQKIILRELDTQFKGSAASQADSSDKLTVAFGNVKESIGTALLPAVDDFSDFMLNKGVPAAERFSDFLTKTGIPAIKDFGDDMRPLAKSVLPAAGDALGIIADGVKTAAPYARDLADAFNDMPDWAKKGAVGGAAGLFAAKKLGVLGGGKKGAVGGLLGLATKAKPLPVFVVNNGTGLGGGALEGGKGGKGGAARNVARGILPVALADAAYETLFGDLYGTLPSKPPKVRGGGQNPSGSYVAAPFGIGLGNPGKGKIQADAKGYEKSLGIVNDAFLKVRDSTEKARGSVRLYDVSIDGLPNDISLAFNTPGLGAAISNTQKYGAYLSDIPRRVVTDFIANRIDKNEGQLERFGGYRANGGTVERGKAYVVGERRPEVFVPKEAGTIQPRVGGGGNSFTVNVHGVDAWAVKREFEHMQLAAAVGGADFR